ncbi:MAG TPA: CHC2 zinc finger domain-containing protein, partial [Pyrinomonadaceae bacterium]|nr:CHC2 zinc finger domain-containing protein [Pyrinomonadaceae bacterium]
MSNLFNEIKETTDIVSIAGLLGISLHKKGTDYFGKCPFPSHQDKTASFTIGGKKRQKFYCFGCGISGDMFDLVEKILGLTKKEALEWLATNLGIKLGKSNKTTEPCRTVDKLKLQNALIQNDSTLLLPKADPVMIDEVYRSLIEKLELKGWAEADLKKRGADLKLFYQLGYRQFPVDLKLRIDIAESISREFHFSNSEKRIPGFFQLPNQKWCFGGNNNGERIFRLKLNGRMTEFIPPGLMVPSFDRNGRIQHIKIRTADFPYQKLEIDLEQYFKWSKLSDPAELEKFKDHRKFSELMEGLKYYPPKYTVLSSKNRLNGCATEVSLHFSQLVKFIDRFSDTLIVTEGELKADLINQQTKLPVIALPAVNLRHEQLFEELKENGKSDSDFAQTLGNWRE